MAPLDFYGLFWFTFFWLALHYLEIGGYIERKKDHKRIFSSNAPNRAQHPELVLSDVFCRAGV